MNSTLNSLSEMTVKYVDIEISDSGPSEIGSAVLRMNLSTMDSCFLMKLNTNWNLREEDNLSTRDIYSM